ncbi:hypothetical protein ACIO3O_37005 [Streptomyces sp. NPDC087440]|uniref:hypothetical protein n=1 Tax=Streptomyces sp. NPDC087440 TaxID=3365790 RepID=UPI0038024848
MSTSPEAPGRDWSGMRRADFDEDAPLALVDTDAVVRPVLAVRHTSGTEALFGAAPAPRGPVRRAGRGAVSPPAGDTLFNDFEIQDSEPNS